MRAYRRAYAILGVLCLAGMSYGQVPKAVITGPKECMSGDLVILDASQSTGQKYLWKMLETDKSFLPTDNNLRCVFAAGVDKERTFHFVLIAAGANANGSPEVDIATHDLLMKPRGQVIVPDIPVNPTPGPVTTKVARAVILYQNEQDNQKFQTLVQSVRSNKELSKLVIVLDKDAKDYNEQPSKAVQGLLKAIGDVALPRVVALSSIGDVISHVEMPATEDDLAKLLKGWGLQ